jgi:PKD repeat protein/C1A family cysteine protease
VGLARINAERQAQGLPALREDLSVPIGSDVLTTSSTDASSQSVGNLEMSASALPRHVDNSTLPSFPPIRNQGSFNSCVPFATSYYQLTNNVALAMGRWTKKSSDNTNKFSPKWAYNMLNQGIDAGTTFYDNYQLLEKHGSVPWSRFPYDSYFRGWDLSGSDWVAALSYRTTQVQATGSLDTDAGLAAAKQLLTNGYVLTFGTYIGSWQFMNSKNDPATTLDDPYVGKAVAYWVNGSAVSHAVTIVGYDDDIWIDINNNGVVDLGEKGALRIANSWGTGWREAGFTWLAYDSVKQVSAVPGGPSAGRVPSISSATVYNLAVRPFYSPKLVAEFTLAQAQRDQLYMALGISTTTQTVPWTLWPPVAISGSGGPYAFNGTTTSVTATFAFDATDLIPAGVKSTNRYYVSMRDGRTPSPSTLSSCSLTDVLHHGAPLVYAGTLPLVADQSTKVAGFDVTFDDTNPPPAATFTASVVSGVPPLAVSFDARASRDPNGTIASYAWNFGDGSPTATGPTPTHAYGAAGYFTVTLTVTDNGGETASHAMLIHVTDKTLPSVSLSWPHAGATVSGTSVALSASAFDNVGVSRVEFSVDGVLVGTAWTDPFSVSWSSRGVGNGSHTIVAKAYDFDGNSAQSGAVSVVTNNDFTPPTVSLTSPANNASVTGTITVAANAADNVGVTRVDFYLDGTTLLGTDSTSPFSLSWTTTGVAHGTHHFSAKARDAAGNSATSANVAVTVY